MGAERGELLPRPLPSEDWKTVWSDGFAGKFLNGNIHEYCCVNRRMMFIASCMCYGKAHFPPGQGPTQAGEQNLSVQRGNAQAGP